MRWASVSCYWWPIDREALYFSNCGLSFFCCLYHLEASVVLLDTMRSGGPGVRAPSKIIGV